MAVPPHAHELAEVSVALFQGAIGCIAGLLGRGRGKGAPWGSAAPFLSTVLASAMLLLTLSLMAVHTAIALVRPGTPVDNPVVVYAAVLGQPLETLAAHTYQCEQPAAASTFRRCRVLTAPSFGELYLLVTGDTVEQVLGVLAADTARLGDFVGEWGMPDVRRNDRGVTFWWCSLRPYRVYAVSGSTAARVSYFTPIDRILVSPVALQPCINS